MSEQPVLVAGATGGTGQQIVLHLLAANRPVRALVRDIHTARDKLGETPELIVGDATLPPTLPAAFKDVALFICTIGSNVVHGKALPEEIDYQGVVNLVDAAKAAGVRHMVLVSSIGATQPDHPLNRYHDVLKWKLKSEDYLRESGLTYTVVRPGGLIDELGGEQAVRFAQGDTISGRIPRADVGRVCVAALDHPDAFNKTFEIISSDDAGAIPQTDFATDFAALEKDT